MQQCLTHDLWSELSQEIHNFLSGISLAELKTHQGVAEVAERQDRKQQEGLLNRVAIES